MQDDRRNNKGKKSILRNHPYNIQQQESIIMACRKAADRALTELSGWMEKQRDEEEARIDTIRNEQEQIWTPRHVFDTCCVKGLADGWETTTATTRLRIGGGGGGSNGCSGGCGKAHPCIVFEWQQHQSCCSRGGDSDDVNGTAVATLSHKLDPFVRYFERLCDDGLAVKMEIDKKDRSSSTDCSSCTYRLNGFLQAHLDRLQHTSQFKPHLYKVSSPNALSASQRAHERHIDREEQLERDAKRRRKNYTATSTQSDASALAVFEKAMTICGDQGLLLEHLGLAEIGWMRLTGRLSDNIVAKVAATMARTRLRQVRLSYSVLLDGMVQFRETGPTYRREEWHRGNTDQQPPQQVYDNNQEDEGCILIPDIEGEIDEYGREIGDRIKKVEMYTCRDSRLPLRNSANDDNENGEDNNTSPLAASNSSPPPDRFVPNEEREFHWESLVLNLAANPLTPSEGDFEFDYRGHVIRVYLEGCSTTVNPPEKDCLFSEQLEVARYRIDPRRLQVGVHTNGKFTFEVVSKEDRVPTSSSRQIQYRGSFRVREIKFDFGDLLGVFVRKKLPLEKLKMQEIRQKRPVTRSEKEYVKALAKAARDAPGSSSAYRGMKGW